MAMQKEQKQPPGGLEPSTYALRKKSLIRVNPKADKHLQRREFYTCPSACSRDLRKVIEAWPGMTEKQREVILAFIIESCPK
jgi:hypothetical protein